MNEIQKICSFFNEIGITWEQCTLPDEPTFLPGIKIDRGCLKFDLEKLKYPGDLLHEAGHLAVETPERRARMSDNVDENQDPAASLEMAAVLWSYAALRYLNLPIEFVFHQEGYKGEADWLIEQFAQGSYLGLPLLQWMGLCYDERNAVSNNQAPFPHMIKWLREA
ncbi:MAG: hypothetical protein SFV55_01545 [Haliscomenobacter sp.]|uniref:hypothetical protein n=1 Tax=Haliscomenobacter sp. TaxID=2717303 RepID=UPI0029AD7788|nr:hypothetical protein [Haliscomenobacter sp.]MDX2067074.1 hypothetical protein [Haliscomenobacter sp.]